MDFSKVLCNVLVFNLLLMLVSRWKHCLALMLCVEMLILQLLERVFPNAEALKKKLKEKYIAEENKRLAELVSSQHCI